MSLFGKLSWAGVLFVVIGCFLILMGQQLENEKMENIGAVLLVVGFCAVVGFGIYGHLRG